MSDLVQIPTGVSQVTDADEEVFLLYTRLAATPPTEMMAGLGYVDSRSPVLNVKVELKLPTSQGNRKKISKNTEPRKRDMTVEVELAQDPTSLRSRKGDTGSVLWRVSIAFAELILQEHYDAPSNPLFNNHTLSRAHVLELGSGTGLLSILFSPLVRRYTVTDIPELMPLIKKNISMNIPSTSTSNIVAQDLDWITLQSTPPALRAKAFLFEVVDLLLVVDCVYHPSLVSPLVDTIRYLTTPGKTTVVVVIELRAEDVVREFLEAWLQNDPRWQIWSVGEQKLSSAYALWMGQLQEEM
ncbi:hypothetical protein BDM02DRAFT_3135456 [Thelephora ganbajun]|uniref:Uncharacterized protein n=1 Tax=Thelephora ganbajun TaxID=370292 RepID=A0ACB6ZUG0_THEGA|nr:hypothetical protein BDM02DRAFT_3135456 [Thelephora ganbajun]